MQNSECKSATSAVMLIWFALKRFYTVPHAQVSEFWEFLQILLGLIKVLFSDYGYHMLQ